tara:strand:+ start:5994 stop:8141 length:2148 start_codon:yes stop_codon:yes gene_type:complete
MDNKVVQSVIINYNANFAQNRPYDNLVPVSGELNIGKNAEVAVYGGSLTRAPIVLRANKNLQNKGSEVHSKSNKTIDLNLVINESYPTQYQTTQSKIVDSAQGAPIQVYDDVSGQELITISLPEGNYSRDNFGDTLSQNINSFIDNKINELQPIGSVSSANFVIGASDVLNEFPYYFDYSNTDDGLFLGLRNNKLSRQDILNGPVNQQLFQQRNNTETQQVGVNLTLDSIGSPVTYSIYGANATAQVENWNSFIRSDQALMPMLTEQKQNGDGNYEGEGTYYSFGLNMTHQAGGISDGKKQICVGFINTLYQSEWTDSNIPEIQAISENDIGEVPNLYLSANFVQVYEASNITKSYIDIFMPDTLNDQGDTFNYLGSGGLAGEPFDDFNALVRLTRIQMPYDLGSDIGEQPNLTGRYEWRFYTEEYKYNNNVLEIGSTTTTKATRVYYFQFISENGANREILYDSKSNGVYINPNWLDDATLFECVESERDSTESVSTGFMPITLFNNCTEEDVLFSPQGNFLLHQKPDGDFICRQRFNKYYLTTKNKDLANTLGIPVQPEDEIQKTIDFDIEVDVNTIKRKLITNNIYNPNAYPINRKEGGLTNIYSDYNRYNIELNLPVKAYNSTETQVNNIGQTRNILFNQDPFVSGSTTLNDANNIVKNIEPNTIKYLTLNNTAPLNINNLRLQIRRAKTNELATEINDTQVEILIKSDRN